MEVRGKGLFYISLSILVMSACAVRAQSYHFESYSLEDGLGQSQVNGIDQDHFGRMWFATQGGGLSVFNGSVFKNYTKEDGFPSNVFYAVEVDYRGNVWASCEKGLIRFDGDSLRHFPFDKPIAKILSLPNGDLYFSHPEGGLGMLQDDSVIRTGSREGFTDERISDIKSDDKGRIWIAVPKAGLFILAGNKFQQVQSIRPDERCYYLYPDSRGDMLIVTYRRMLRMNGDDLSCTRMDIGAQKRIEIRSICEDASGKLWFGSSHGAFLYDGSKLTRIDHSKGLSDVLIPCIYRDREGNVWFATYGEGVYQFKGETFRFINKNHGMSNEVVMGITKDKNGALWLSTMGGGLHRYDGKSMKIFNRETGFPGDYFGCLVTGDDGYIWATSHHSGILKIDPETYRFKRLTTRNSNMISDRIINVKKDSNGDLWFASSHGVMKYDGNAFKNYPLPAHASDRMVWSLMPLSDGRLLIGTGVGLAQVVNDSLVFFTGNDHVEKGQILSIATYNEKEVYLGIMEEGILRYNLNTAETYLISTDLGIASNLIYSLIFDNNGNLFAGTEKGIDRISFQDNGKVLLVRNYSVNEGFFGIETNQDATFKDADGAIWFGSIRGAFRYNPDADRLNLQEPDTYLTGVKLFYRDIDWTKYASGVTSWHNLPQELRLPYDENHLIFEYRSSSLRNPDKVRYQYKLEPFDQDWSPPFDNREAVYVNIPPGDYVFKVKSCNNDGIWNEDPTRLAFTIVAPFWQKWWFYAGVAALILVMLRLIYVHRIRVRMAKLLALEKARSEESERVRKMVARDFQDELGNHLASISMLTQVLKTKVNPSAPETDVILTRLQDYSKELFGNAKDFLWSLEPKSDRLEEVILYVKDLGEEVFDKSPVEFVVNESQVEKQLVIPVGWSRQVALIFKAAFSEYKKQQRALLLEFKPEQEEGQLIFRLNQCGVAYRNDEVIACSRFKKMKKRADRIRAVLTFRTSPGERRSELRLVLKLPLKNRK